MNIEELKLSVYPGFIVAVDTTKDIEVTDSGFVYDSGDTILEIPMAIESLQKYKDSGLLDTYMIRNTFGAYVSKKALEIRPELFNYKSVYIDIEDYDKAQKIKSEYFKRLDEIIT